MTIIKEYAEKMKDELCDAKYYAEQYLYHKAFGNGKISKYYYDMAMDEIRHSNHIHEIATDEITKLKSVYTPAEDMEQMWIHAHNKYVEEAAMIEQMLKM